MTSPNDVDQRAKETSSPADLLRTAVRGLSGAIAVATTSAALAGAFAAALAWGMVPLARYVLGASDGPINSGARGWMLSLLSRSIDTATPMAALVGTAILLFGVYFAKNLFDAIARRTSARMAIDIEARLRRSATFEQLQRPLESGSPDSGDVLSRLMEEAGRVSAFVELGPIRLIGDTVTIIGLLATMAILSPWLSLTVVALLPLGWLASALAQQMVGRSSEPSLRARAELSGHLSELLRGRKWLLANGGVIASQTRLQSGDEMAITTAKRLAQHMALLPPIVEVFAAAVGATVLAAGGYLVLVKGTLGGAELMTFLTASLLCMAPIKRLAEVATRWRVAKTALERLHEIATIPSARSSWPGTAPWPKKATKLSLEAITKNRDGRGEILSGVSFTMDAGTSYALWGESGVGKTTLLDVIAGLVTPDDGQVAVGGEPTMSLSWQELRSNIAYLPQETFLLHGTVRNNLLFGGSGHEDCELTGALRQVRLGKIIDLWPLGLDTLIGEKGDQLSGGEARRLALARATLNRPAVLLLDEPTAHVDAQSEAVFLDGILDIVEDAIVVVATHRESVARAMDVAVVLSDGKVAHMGPPTLLASVGGGNNHRFTERSTSPSE